MTTTKLPDWVRIQRRPLAVSERAAPTHYTINSPSDAAALLKPLAAVEEQEVFWLLCLNVQSRVQSITEVTRGIANGSLVHPREVFRVAIATGAVSIIVAHNHPSGEPAPSPEDRAVTKQLVEAGKLLDIPVLDHVITGDGRFYSFAEAGAL
jgi:DNA repair protein RadC